MKLVLNELKAVYKTLKTGTTWLDHLLLGLLVFIENLLINNRVEKEVNAAIARHRAASKEYVSPHPPDMVTPIYTETPSASANSHSDTSTSLPNMRLTAPWYIDKVSERSEPPESL